MPMVFRLFSSIAVSKARNASASIAIVAMSRRFSSTAVISRPGDLSASSAVVNVISKHIQELSKKSALILRMRERLHGCGVLSSLERELLQSQPRVVHQLVFLRKLYGQIVPADHTDAQVKDKDKAAPLTVVTKRLQYLRDMLDLISRAEEVYHCPGVPIDNEQIAIISSKPLLVHQFIALKNVLEGIVCEIELAFENGLTDDVVLPKSAVGPWSCYCDTDSYVVMPQEEQEWSLDKRSLDKHRYLLLSNGCEIHCLDLKQGKNQPMTHDVPLLPIIATLNLLAEDLPTTPALFKWRSKVYMIGGQAPPPVLSKEGVEDLCRSNKVKPTSSCLIHGLSLDDSKTILSHSDQSNLLGLKKPKFCPIVQVLNGKIHLIDSLPPALACGRQHTWTATHDIFDCNTGCWIEEAAFPEGDATFPILSYLVVGTNIYAKLSNNRHLFFHARKSRWHVSSAPKRKPCGLPKDAWCILDKSLVVSNNVGGFPYGDAEDPLYVVIALMLDRDVVHHYGAHAEAFLVNSSGQVLCTQSLKRFFNGFGVYQGKIMKVEEDVWGKKTMCFIVTGRQLGWSACTHQTMSYVLINTFDVKELPGAADKVREVLAKGSEAWPVEMEFVQIDVLDRYVYKSDTKLCGAGGWVDVQACFL